ncbi:2-amino-4-hydroxy-6-hydroxymethyldihydropteridine diphosphokinase [Terrisporobacter glycolicus]|uniref:2-amino-4-hydroxy-6-hydroxymethyldihydropteridine diphosphokinase n=1 Tax=Terrisporobacter glycolicus ATCC 14880 = DSM 1288 TaxID=1121315 RepID=A0ABZ2ET11_9FIRM|nr:2-amino-4-hydroxy-6-hydroxymethyldihydropteridine diphosphokinase [Terrisporobacter glycolicus]
MNKAYLGLGTNMGHREGYLRQACKTLQEHVKINISKISKVYETKAWGYTEQDDFLNICMEIETSLSSIELLEVCHAIEEMLNRERVIKWGPRTIDVDILFFNNIISNDERLTLPHPRIRERAFVLIPLMDLNKGLTIDNEPISYYLSKLSKEERDEVKEVSVNI